LLLLDMGLFCEVQIVTNLFIGINGQILQETEDRRQNIPAIFRRQETTNVGYAHNPRIQKSEFRSQNVKDIKRIKKF